MDGQIDFSECPFPQDLANLVVLDACYRGLTLPLKTHPDLPDQFVLFPCPWWQIMITCRTLLSLNPFFNYSQLRWRLEPWRLLLGTFDWRLAKIGRLYFLLNRWWRLWILFLVEMDHILLVKNDHRLMIIVLLLGCCWLPLLLHFNNLLVWRF